MKKQIKFFILLFVNILFFGIPIYAENRLEDKYRTASAGYYGEVIEDVRSYDYRATAIINSLTMKQNNEYYTINYDITWSCPSLSFNPSLVIGQNQNESVKTDIYQKPMGGNLYVADANRESSLKRNITETLSGNTYTIDGTYMGYTVKGKDIHTDTTTTTTIDSYAYIDNFTWLPGSVYKGSYVSKRNSYNKVFMPIKRGFNGATLTYNGYEVVYPCTITTNSSTGKLQFTTNYSITPIQYNSYVNTTFTKIVNNSDEELMMYKMTGSAPTCTYVGTSNQWAYRYTGSFTIPKGYEYQAKYIGMECPIAVPTYKREKVYTASSTYGDERENDTKGIGVIGDAIDLSSYYNCEHNWICEESNDTTHKVKCSKCDLENSESHTYTLTADEIVNNKCICGKQLKIRTKYINIDGNGTNKTIDTNIGSALTPPTITNKTGYTPDKTTFETGTASVSKTHTVTWTENSYTITYNVNGGTWKIGYTAPNSRKYTVATTLPNSTQISKTGYTFGGWYESSTFTGSAITTISANTASNKTLYAKWTENSYSITYNLNGGSWKTGYTATNSRKYTVATTLPNSTQISKTGYTFGGWYESSTFTGSAITSISANTASNKTLYAKWTENSYTITYNLNGGTWKTGYTAPASRKYTVATTLPNSSQMSKTGYTFGGWYESSTFTGSAITSISANTASNKTLYAKWTENSYTITYNVNGGVWKTGYTAPASRKYTVATTLPNSTQISKTGYTFGGWYESSTFTGSAITNISANTASNKTLYAKWTENSYTITYNVNGGVWKTGYTAPASRNYTVATTLPNSSQISKTGYTFSGWYESSTFTGSAITSINANIETNIILYAKWEANKYIFNFSNDNNFDLVIEGEVLKQEFIYDIPQIINSGIGITNYDFIGWSLTYKGINVDFSPNQEILNWTAEPNKEYTLYPVYQKTKYTINCKYYQEELYKNIVIEATKGESQSLPIIKTLPPNKSNCYWKYDDKKVEITTDLDIYVSSGGTIEITYYTNDEIINCYKNDEELKINIKCKFNQNEEIEIIELNNIIIGNTYTLPKMKALPIKAKCHWYYNDVIINNVEDIYQFVVINNENLEIEYKDENGKAINVYIDDGKEFTFNVKYNYKNETGAIIKSENNIPISTTSELIKLKYLPLNAEVKYWCLENKKETCYEKYSELITLLNEDNETIELYAYPNDGTVNFYNENDNLELKYNILCEYYQNDELKTILLNDILIGSSKNLPKMKVLPKDTSNCYWTYNNEKVETTSDIDKFVKVNNDTLKITYYTNNKQLNVYNDNESFKYNIKCNYKQDNEIKNIMLNDIEFNNNNSLPKLKALPVNAICHWYYKDKIVNKISDLDKYVIVNNEIIEIEYKDENGKSINVYIDDGKEFTFNVKYNYKNETGAIIKSENNIPISTTSELIKLKHLPLNAEVKYWCLENKQENIYAKYSELITLLNEDNETIELYAYPNDGTVNFYEYKETIKLKYNIKCNYMSNGENKVIEYSNIEIGTVKDLPILKTLPIGTEVKGWTYNDIVCKTFSDVEKFVKVNDEIIELYYKSKNGDSISSYLNDNKISYKIKCSYQNINRNKVIDIATISCIIGEKSDFTEPKINSTNIINKKWIYKNIEVNNSLDVDKYVIDENSIIDVILKIQYLEEKSSYGESEKIKKEIKTENLSKNQNLVLNKTTNNDNENNNKKEETRNKLRRKGLFEYISEIYGDFNNNKTTISNKKDIIDIIEIAYSNFNNSPKQVDSNNINYNNDIITFINDIYNDFKENN